MNADAEPFVPFPGFSAATQRWGQLRLIDFNMIYRLELFRVESGKEHHFDLFVSLDHISHQPTLRLNLKFISIVELVLPDNWTQIFIRLRDIGGRGWENTNYEIWSDDERLFQCKDAELLSVEQLVTAGATRWGYASNS